MTNKNHQDIFSKLFAESLVFLMTVIIIMVAVVALTKSVYAINPINSTYFLKDSSSSFQRVLDTNLLNGSESLVSVTAGSTQICTTFNWTNPNNYTENKLIPSQNISILLFADSGTAGGGSASIANLFVSEWNGSAEVQTIASNASPTCNFYGKPAGFNCTFPLPVQGSKNISTGDFLRLRLDLCARKVTANLRYNSSSRNSSLSIIEETVVSAAGNALPNISAPVIIPSQIFTTSSLNCSAIAYDNESSSLNISFTWYRNRTRITTYDSNVSCTNGTVCYTSTLVPSSALYVNDNWTCSARSYDGTFFSNFSNSTTLTVFGTAPYITSIVIDDDFPPVSVIDLRAGAKTKVYCNGTAVDSDGFSDIMKINATFFNSAESFASDIDNQTKHYSNASCNFTQAGQNSSFFSCSFGLAYFARNGTWQCNVSAFDSSFSNSSLGNANVSELLAINVTPVIDFGDLAVGAISAADVVSSVSNIGNIPADLNLYGYASTPGDNNAMACTLGNIPVGYERYNFSSGIGHASMSQLTGDVSGTTHYDFNLQPENNTQLSSRNVYWKMQVPNGVRGQCTGTIVFSGAKSQP